MNENLNRVSFHSLKEKQPSRNTIQLQNENDQFRPINRLGPLLSSAPRGRDPPVILAYWRWGSTYTASYTHTGLLGQLLHEVLQLLMY
jgi:hypothetical protein